MTSEHEPVQVGRAEGGAVTYLVATAPEALPAVSPRDLAAAWDAARTAALDEHWGEMRLFRFRRPDGGLTDLALTDRDACCWARAVDRTADMSRPYGLSLCLRLLALIDLLAAARWATALFQLQPDGATLHPAALRAAATQPLTAEARFDEISLRERLRALAPAVPPPAPGPRA